MEVGRIFSERKCFELKWRKLGGVEVMQITENNEVVVNKGTIHASGVRWLHEKLILFAEYIKTDGNKPLTASQVDVGVRLSMHIKWKHGGVFELRIPGDGKPTVPAVLLIPTAVECMGWKSLAAGISLSLIRRPSRRG